MGGSTVPMENSGLSPASTSSSLHDLDAAVTNDSHGDSAALDGKHDSSGTSQPLEGVGVEGNCADVENGGSSSSPDNNMPTAEDVSPIESARARVLQFVLDHFITDHLIEVAEPENDCTEQAGADELNTREVTEVRYEGDPAFPLPHLYVVNMYETLVKEVDTRIASLDGIDEKTIRVGLTLSKGDGLYKRLRTKFPRTGPRTFGRRKLRTSIYSRTHFPDIRIVREKIPPRLTVVNGLEIVVKPNGIPIDDAECETGWLETGSADSDSETDDSSSDSAGHGFRSNARSRDQQAAPSTHQMKTVPNQPQFHQRLNQQVHQTSRTSHFPQNPPATAHSHHSPTSRTSHFPQNPPATAHSRHSPTILPHKPCLPPHAAPRVGGGMRVMASPARFCDQCGTRYLSETSKFCSECGLSRQNVQKKVNIGSRSEHVTVRNEGAALPHDSKLYSPRDKQKPVGSDWTSHLPKFSEIYKTYNSSSTAVAQGFPFSAKSPNQPAAPPKHQTQPISHGRTGSTLAKSRGKRKQCVDCETDYRDGEKDCSCADWSDCTIC